MEAKRNLPRTLSLSVRNGKMTQKTLNFQKVARQVMLANMFTRTRSNVEFQEHGPKMAAGGERRAVSKIERKRSSAVEEKPQLKRRGTPELFPMSEEMRQTIISLGKLDLLPDDERNSRAEKVERTRAARNIFRDKTRRRIIHPQRFIRNVRSSLNNSKSIIVENDDHFEETPYEDGDCLENPTDNGICSTDEASDPVLISTKSNCNILSRPQTTHFNVNATSAKSKHCQTFSLARRPLYTNRHSDVGLVSRKPAGRRFRSQGTWPVSVSKESRILSSTAQRHPLTKSKNTVKVWEEGSEISKSTVESEMNSNAMLKTRRWQSVDSLTKEIEEKCSSWLENRYGIIQWWSFREGNVMKCIFISERDFYFSNVWSLYLLPRNLKNMLLL